MNVYLDVVGEPNPMCETELIMTNIFVESNKHLHTILAILLFSVTVTSSTQVSLEPSCHDLTAFGRRRKLNNLCNVFIFLCLFKKKKPRNKNIYNLINSRCATFMVARQVCCVRI